MIIVCIVWKHLLWFVNNFSCLNEVAIGKKIEGDGENAAMNTFNVSQKNKANIVGQQLLLNMPRYASTGNQVR